jgi:hypothetical protein
LSKALKESSEGVGGAIRRRLRGNPKALGDGPEAHRG